MTATNPHPAPPVPDEMEGLVDDAEIERLFAEVAWTSDHPGMNAAQVAFACRVVELALYRERTSLLQSRAADAKTIAVLREATDPANVRHASKALIESGHGLLGGLLILMADRQDAALTATQPQEPS